MRLVTLTSTRGFPQNMQSSQHMTVTVGERRWIWTETCFLDGVLPMSRKGGAKDEGDLTRQIKLAVLEQRGVPLEKMHVILQPMNDQDQDPNLDDQKKALVEPLNGMWVTIWIQWLPEVMKREKQKIKGGRLDMSVVDRNFMITASFNVAVDAKLLKKWGTTTHEPPVNDDRFAWKAIARR